MFFFFFIVLFFIISLSSFIFCPNYWWVWIYFLCYRAISLAIFCRTSFAFLVIFTSHLSLRFTFELFSGCSLYDLANVVPTLANFYHQASEAYEQACTRHISSIIFLVSIYLLVLLLVFPSYISWKFLNETISVILSTYRTEIVFFSFLSNLKDYSNLPGKSMNCNIQYLLRR